MLIFPALDAIAGNEFAEVPFAAADERYGLTATADEYWGLDAFFAGATPTVYVHNGPLRVAGDVHLRHGAHRPALYIVDGDLSAAGLLRVEQDDSSPVLVVTGDLTAERLALDGAATLWVHGGLRVTRDLLTALRHSGSIVVRGPAVAPAWVQIGDRAEIRLGEGFTGRVAQTGDRLRLRVFPQAEAVDTLDLPWPLRHTDALARLADGLPLLPPGGAPTGPVWQGRPVALIDRLTVTGAKHDTQALAALPDSTTFPRLRALTLTDDRLNAAVARWDLPVLEELALCGPHVAPVGSDRDTIPADMFARMPALRRVWLRQLRSMPEALLDVPGLRSVDFSQQLTNPAFHTAPDPGLRLADVARLKARHPSIRVAFGDDVCFELPPLYEQAVERSSRIAGDATAGRLDEAEAALADLLPEVLANLDVLSHVLLYDLRSLAIHLNGVRDAPLATQVDQAETALAELGPPDGWFLANRSRDACLQLARWAGNTVGWLLRDTDPGRALAAATIAMAGTRPGAAEDDWVRDTYVRCLLSAGRTEDAFAAAHDVLRRRPGCEQLQDIAALPRYQRQIHGSAGG